MVGVRHTHVLLPALLPPIFRHWVMTVMVLGTSGQMVMGLADGTSNGTVITTQESVTSINNQSLLTDIPELLHSSAERISPDLSVETPNSNYTIPPITNSPTTTTTGIPTTTAGHSSKNSPLIYNSTSTQTPTLDIKTEGNVSKVKIQCLQRDFDSAPPADDESSSNTTTRVASPSDNRTDIIDTNAAAEPSSSVPISKSPVVVPSLGDRESAVLDLSQLREGVGIIAGLVVVDGCEWIELGGKLPDWVEQLSISSDGTLVLQPGWSDNTVGLRGLWVRSAGGMGDVRDQMGGLCGILPPSITTLDVSHTPLKELVLEERCSPPELQHLSASHSSLERVSLCTPTLASLHLSSNNLSGGLGWAACKDGVAGVESLHVNHNALTEASTCSWRGLHTLDIRRNLLITLDLVTCPAFNLSTLNAAHNQLLTAPTLPPSLLYLDLSRNKITLLPSITPAVMSADFSHNDIFEIGKTKFKRARKLLNLNIAHNRLTKIRERDLAGLRDLRNLDLSHNRLREVAPASLLHLRHLRRLHLHHNHLHILDARDLAALSRHAHATFYDNPWQCSCHLLSSLQKLSTCPDCHEQAVALECRERNSWIPASSVLHSCLQAVHEVTQRLNDESDEDLSEEDNDDQFGHEKSHDKGNNVVVVVPGLVVLLLIGIVAVLSYKLYHKHRRSMRATLVSYCGMCRVCGWCSSDPYANHNHHTHNQLQQQDAESDTETEL